MTNHRQMTKYRHRVMPRTPHDAPVKLEGKCGKTFFGDGRVARSIGFRCDGRHSVL